MQHLQARLHPDGPRRRDVHGSFDGRVRHRADEGGHAVVHVNPGEPLLPVPGGAAGEHLMRGREGGAS